MENIPTRESIAAAINSPAVVAAVARKAANAAEQIRARKPDDGAGNPVMSVCLYDGARALGHEHDAALCLAAEVARLGLERVRGVKATSVDALRALDALGSSLSQAIICNLVMGFTLEQEAA